MICLELGGANLLISRLTALVQTPMSLKLSFSFFVVVCLSAVVMAQTSVTTDPVGFATTSCLGNSDTYLGIPFTRLPEFIGTVQSVGTNTLTINGTPGWASNRFVYAAGTQPKHYYVLIGNGGATNPPRIALLTGHATEGRSHL